LASALINILKYEGVVNKLSIPALAMVANIYGILRRFSSETIYISVTKKILINISKINAIKPIDEMDNSFLGAFIALS